jgi:hypothetical protein
VRPPTAGALLGDFSRRSLGAGGHWRRRVTAGVYV